MRAQVTLPTAPFHVGTNRATNNQSWGPAQHGDPSVPTSAARPTVCLSAPPSGPERTNALLRPRAAQWWKSNTSPPLPASPPHPPPSKDRKEAIMFKHPHYEPQVSRCGSLSIKGFNRWRKREWGERERGGRRREGEGQREGGQKGRLETVLFLY